MIIHTDTIRLFALLFLCLGLLVGCQQSDTSPNTGSESHWLSCEQHSDCMSGQICVAKRCEPDALGVDQAQRDQGGGDDGSACDPGATRPNCCWDDSEQMGGFEAPAVCQNSQWVCPTQSHDIPADDVCESPPPVDMGGMDGDMAGCLDVGIYPTCCERESPQDPWAESGDAPTCRDDQWACPDSTKPLPQDYLSCDTIPISEPSSREVTLRVTNELAATRYIAQDGFFCDAFEIERGGARIDRQAGWECGCECPGPPSPGVVQWRKLGPGQSFDLSWDARRLVYWSELLYCGPDFYVNTYGNAFRAAPAGTDYRATLIVLNDLPAGCVDPMDGSDSISCDTQLQEPNLNGEPTASLCPEATMTISQDFTLPASGDTVVDIKLQP